MHADGIERRVLPVLAVAHAHLSSTRTHKNAVLEECSMLSSEVSLPLVFTAIHHLNSTCMCYCLRKDCHHHCPINAAAVFWEHCGP